jgi:hypothetical protein
VAAELSHFAGTSETTDAHAAAAPAVEPAQPAPHASAVPDRSIFDLREPNASDPI